MAARLIQRTIENDMELVRPIAAPAVKKRTQWTSELLSTEIRRLHSSRADLGYRAIEKTNRGLLKAGKRLHGTWRAAVEAQGIPYKERRPPAAAPRQGKEYWTRERLLDLIERKWRAGEDLSPTAPEVKNRAAPAAKRLFGAKGGWRKAIETASAERELGIDYSKHVIKNQVNRWTREGIVSAIAALAAKGEPVNREHARDQHTALWSAAGHHFAEEGGWNAALKEAGIDLAATQTQAREAGRKKQQTPLRDPDVFGLALMQMHARAHRKIPYHKLGRAMQKWVSLHGGIEPARELAEKARAGLDEQEAVVLAHQAGEKNAAKKLIAQHAPLVSSIARKAERRGLEPIELTSVGNAGLIKAAETFDFTKRKPFGAYARTVISRAISRATARGGRTIRIPEHAIRERSRLAAKDTEAFQRGGELSEQAKRETIGARAAARTRGFIISSLDESAPHDERALIEKIDPRELYPERPHTPQEIVELSEEKQRIRRALEVMERTKPNYAQVLRKRFGFEGREKTLQETGDEMGFTKENARVQERKALEMMREIMLEQTRKATSARTKGTA